MSYINNTGRDRIRPQKQENFMNPGPSGIQNQCVSGPECREIGEGLIFETSNFEGSRTSRILSKCVRKYSKLMHLCVICHMYLCVFNSISLTLLTLCKFTFPP